MHMLWERDIQMLFIAEDPANGETLSYEERMAPETK